MVQAEKRQLRLRVLAIVLAALLIFSVGGLLVRYLYLMYNTPASATVSVPDNLLGSSDTAGGTQDVGGELAEADLPIKGSSSSSTSQQKAAGTATALELYKQKAEDNAAFEASDMLPGDSEVKYFSVKAHHTEDIELFFKAEITSQTKALGDVLNVKVTHLDTGAVLCDKPISQINGSEFKIALAGSQSGESTAYFEVEASLDTSVGNQYQGANLTADLNWYCEDGLTAPQTGDMTDIILWSIVAFCALALIIALLLMRKRDGGKSRPGSPLVRSISAVVVLALGLCVTTFALVYSAVAVDNNRFGTASVEINLNDSKPVISEDEFLFEPGMTVEKEFFVQNNSTVDVYYKLYFENVEGELAEFLEITVKDADNELFSGKAADFVKDKAKADEAVLGAAEKRVLTISFHMPDDVENDAMGKALSFTMGASAVQAKNNPDRLFA